MAFDIEKPLVFAVHDMDDHNADGPKSSLARSTCLSLHSTPARLRRVHE